MPHAEVVWFGLGVKYTGLDSKRAFPCRVCGIKIVFHLRRFVVVVGRRGGSCTRLDHSVSISVSDTCSLDRYMTRKTKQMVNNRNFPIVLQYCIVQTNFEKIRSGGGSRLAENKEGQRSDVTPAVMTSRLGRGISLYLLSDGRTPRRVGWLQNLE